MTTEHLRGFVYRPISHWLAPDVVLADALSERSFVSVARQRIRGNH
jgi:hypothetical protein